MSGFRPDEDTSVLAWMPPYHLLSHPADRDGYWYLLTAAEFESGRSPRPRLACDWVPRITALGGSPATNAHATALAKFAGRIREWPNVGMALEFRQVRKPHSLRTHREPFFYVWDQDARARRYA